MAKNKISGFPKEFAEVIADGNKNGITDELMIKGMISLGNLFGKFVQPDSPEEAIMKEMWETATPAEKDVMASLVLRMGKNRLH